jgi:hypothetical protein
MAKFDFGEIIVDAEEERAKREEQLDYIRDYLEEFVEYCESYLPYIAEEFIEKWPSQYKRWKKYGYVIKIGGSN